MKKIRLAFYHTTSFFVVVTNFLITTFAPLLSLSLCFQTQNLAWKPLFVIESTRQERRRVLVSIALLVTVTYKKEKATIKRKREGTLKHDGETGRNQKKKTSGSSSNYINIMGFDIAAFAKAYEANPSKALEDEFWTNYDGDNWSLWRCTYDYPEDTETLDDAKAIVTSFMNNTSALEGTCKCFGVMHTLANYEIEGLWFFEGPDPEPLFGCNEDTSWFSWNQIGPDASDAVKSMVKDIWAANNSQYNGKDIQDTQTKSSLTSPEVSFIKKQSYEAEIRYIERSLTAIVWIDSDILLFFHSSNKIIIETNRRCTRRSSPSSRCR